MESAFFSIEGSKKLDITSLQNERSDVRMLRESSDDALKLCLQEQRVYRRDPFFGTTGKTENR